MIPISEFCKKYNFDYYRLLRWIKKGYVKAVKKEVVLKHKAHRAKKEAIQKVNMWYVDEDSFLAIPAFVRRGRKEETKTLQYFKKVKREIL